MRESINPRRYANHIALATSICDPSKYFDEARCDALMEENDVWVIVPFEELVVDFEIVTDSNLQMVGSIEIQGEKTGVGENTSS
jgi:hypothetical protein